MLRIFTSEKSNGFGRVWTRKLGTEHCKWDPIAYFETYVAYYI